MQTSLTYRTNRNLFSNHYLDKQLPETEAWEEVSDDELQSAREEIMELWEQEKDTAPKRNESQLEEKFIRPMFRKLGIPFEVEESINQNRRRPDYGFFETEEAISNAFQRREEGGDFYNNAVAVADAKRWGRPLDTSGEKKRDYENPSHQIDQYLRFSSTTWGVLTNGKKWRLYYKPTSHKLDSYYEIDLPTVLEQGDLDDFKRFYLFFRHEAFIEDATGDCFLDDVYNGSNIFAEELGEDLQDNIYEAIKILSEGFLQYPENDLDEDDLELIHDSSLIYLYRVIFVLYAEAEGRDLLDTDNEIYEQSYSLNALKQEVAEELDSGSPKYQNWQDDLWDQLDGLFQLIDQGSKSRGIPEDDLYIPAYNGGLFRTDPDESDSDEAQFLAEHQAGDAYLAQVIELLTRNENGDGSGKIFVDYSSLDVRHLGSIYEGLLEYQLHVADEQLAVEDGDDGEYVPAGENDEVVVEEGEIYLTTDSGERKATGSYYTPEYVVEYIVENTLGPLVEDIRKDLAGQTAHGEGGFAEEFADRIFELKVLDPAMGSGHFLTSAVDYLAREIIDAQEKQAAQEGIETVDEERDINWARRQVAQRCIYGVDLNPLAVELSKVSLWLRTLAAEQPLAFLDHHLKTGNSLVGSDIERVLDTGDPDNGTEEGQLTLQDSFDRTRRQALEHVTDQFEDLLAIDNETLDDIKEMEVVYEEVRDDQLYQHLIAMANVHTAEQFGLDVPADAHERMAEALRDDSWADIEGQDWYASAQAMAEDQRFFHWELEFPIAFYEQDGERKEDGGFDAVIGNPPYIIFKMIPDDIRDYYRDTFDTFQMKGDVYVLFMEVASNLLRHQGLTGYIIQNKFMKAKYGSEIREKLSSKEKILEIVDFHDSPVFDITAYPMILLRQKMESPSDYQFTWRDIKEGEQKSIERSLTSNKTGWTITQSDLGSDVWHPFVSDDVISEDTTPVEEFADQIGQGAIPGNTEVYLVDENIVEEYGLERDCIKRVLRGGDVEQFTIESPENLSQLIYPYDIVEGEPEIAAPDQIPNIISYLEEFKSDLIERKNYGKRLVDQGYEWYELRYEAPGMINEKIVFPDISPENRFAHDQNGDFACLDTVYYIVRGDSNPQYESDYLVAILNSSILDYIFDRMSPKVRGGYRRYKTQYVESLPIPVIDFTNVKKLSDDTKEQIKSTTESVFAGEMTTAEALDSYPDDDGKIVLHDALCHASQLVSDTKRKRRSLNLSLLDYLGIPSDELPDAKAGDTLGEMQMPVAGVADTPLVETTEEYDGLRIEGVSFAEDGGRVVLSVDVSYKVEEDDPRETDRWDRLTESEFETYEAMAFVGLSEAEETLLREFVPVAVEEADGFAGFRQGAGKTISPLDRLKDLTLPDIAAVQDGLEQYVEVRGRADELEEKIERTDQLIDEIVYDLYGLTDEEIEIVEDAVADD